MTWNNYADYDLPKAILSGMSEWAFDINEGGYVSLPTDRPLKFFLQFAEPLPPYAEELRADLLSYEGEVHESKFPSLLITVTSDLKEADAVITFHVDDLLLYGDAERLAYHLKWRSSEHPECGGTFHVRCCDPPPDGTIGPTGPCL
jgi:hypothetical protein